MCVHKSPFYMRATFSCIIFAKRDFWCDWSLLTDFLLTRINLSELYYLHSKIFFVKFIPNQNPNEGKTRQNAENKQTFAKYSRNLDFPVFSKLAIIDFWKSFWSFSGSLVAPRGHLRYASSSHKTRKLEKLSYPKNLRSRRLVPMHLCQPGQVQSGRLWQLQRRLQTGRWETLVLHQSHYYSRWQSLSGSRRIKYLSRMVLVEFCLYCLTLFLNTWDFHTMK